MADKYNAERYSDPTAYAALTNIEREEKAARKTIIYRPVVYICSPFSGNVEYNTKRARAYSRFAVDYNAIPIAPHLLFPQFMSEEKERNLAVHINKVILNKCREVWVFGTEYSKGMKQEIAYAKKKDKIIRYFTENMEEIKYE